MTAAVGMVGGLVGGLVIRSLANQTLSGFPTGIVGSCMGALIALTIWDLVARPAHRRA
jgi:uncharacterized membrane protein YeaQ/YmgE (transglycosylase-associated protein family)